MKTLYLMRHAKSSWSFDDLTDHDRPLNERGRDDAPRMGKALADRHIKLDLLISSPAVRALSTAALVAKEIGYPNERIEVQERIYRAEPADLLDIVRKLPDTANAVLLVGHNNTITDFANLLSPNQIEDMSTAAVVCLHLNIDRWQETDRSTTEFYFYDYPGNHQ